MNGVKVALGNRGMTVEAARQCARDRKEWRALVTALPCSGGYHMERGGMPYHDAVGKKPPKGATTENQSQVSSIWAKGCILMTLCVFYLT